MDHWFFLCIKWVGSLPIGYFNFVQRITSWKYLLYLFIYLFIYWAITYILQGISSFNGSLGLLYLSHLTNMVGYQ
jgi:hypothetical protein